MDFESLTAISLDIISMSIPLLYILIQQLFIFVLSNECRPLVTRVSDQYLAFYFLGIEYLPAKNKHWIQWLYLFDLADSESVFLRKLFLTIHPHCALAPSKKNFFSGIANPNIVFYPNSVCKRAAFFFA